MISLCAKFYDPNYSDSLIMIIKLKVKNIFAWPLVFLFYILSEYFLINSCIYFQDLLPCIITELNEMVAVSLQLRTFQSPSFCYLWV